MIGAQASNDQLEKILSYFDIGRGEGAKVLTGGERAMLEGELADGYYVKPTVLEGHNKMRVFQEEIFGPVVSVTTFKDEADALAIANDTLYGLGAGVWSRNGNTAYRMGRGIQAGRVWTNCYHHYPAHAAFGGYKQSGIGRENHRMMLDHYQQTKNLLVSYSPKALGFFCPTPADTLPCGVVAGWWVRPPPGRSVQGGARTLAYHCSRLPRGGCNEAFPPAPQRRRVGP
jgi:aldehyde dehydrogenase